MKLNWESIPLIVIQHAKAAHNGFIYFIRETYDHDFELKITHSTNYAIAELHTSIPSLEEAKRIAEEHASK